MVNAHERTVELLRARGVHFAIHRHAAAPTVAEARATLPFPFEQFLKTVVFRVKDGAGAGGDPSGGAGGWVLVALRGQDRVDYRKLAAALGVRRGDLVRPSPEEIMTGLGLPFGGIGPIPPNNAARVVFDAAALDLGTVYCGVGSDEHTLEIDVHDLAAVTGGLVAPVSQAATG